MRVSRWGLSAALLLQCFVSVTAKGQDNIDLDSVNLSDLLDVRIESASKQSEPWAEVPVPVTVITKDMIKLSGVRNIHEALTLFVPGYTDAEDRNESNFAPRGIYATSQQKVLILLNGHRINSRSYLTAMPDYGIAVHNLERIEVLRGPGSSLYGNVALAGVVNLITKKGRENNKNMAEIGAGNFDQQKVRLLTGDGGEDWDILAWGQVYRTEGEVHRLDGNEKYNPGKTGTIRIDGVENETAHDFGVTYRKKNWTFFGASRRGQWIEPYATGGNTYNYDEYRTFQGAGPGLGMSHQHLGAKYDTDLGGDWTFDFNPYYDRTEIEAILVGATAGTGTAFTWADQDIGFITQANKNYKVGSGEGSLLLGAQIDAFEVKESAVVSMVAGDLDTYTDATGTRLLELGGEQIYSLFVQDKHKFNSKWILNAGARYDHKNRKRGASFEKVSPRVALIHLPNDTWEYKLSYSQSFVDAPYWYRFNRGLAAFGGSENLDPEILEAVQLQGVWKSNDKRLRNAVTLYYQNGTNLITNRATAAGTPADPKYINSGRIESTGVENEFSWLENSFQFFWNLQYAQALSSIDYSRFDGKFAHVPSFTSNAVFNYLFTKDLSANITVKYIGDQVYNTGSLTSPLERGVAGATLLNLGGRHENIASTGFFVDGRVYNVFDTTHYQGGQSGTQIPFRQAGRWYFVSLGREF